jgi:NAD(P)-dependent dehydrogenase (short-subunit alcohol dehydrogenase family)
MTSSIDLRGQVAIVTGGGRGLGRAFAEALAAAGCAVAVVARSAAELAETVRLVERTGGQARPFTADVTDAGAVDNAFAEIKQDALSRRLIAGAALDVWYRYPRAAGPTTPATRPFHELPNVLMTPHVSGWTDGMLDARARLIAENSRRIGCQEAALNLISS